MFKGSTQHATIKPRIVLLVLLALTAGALVTWQLGRPAATGTARPTTTVRSAIDRERSGADFLTERITAVGDSVMLDYQQLVAKDLPRVSIHAAVGERWARGISELASLRAHHRLGATVIVALGTDGPVTPVLMQKILSALAGASRIVLVTEHIARPWQNSNNALVLKTAADHAGIVVANWYADSRPRPKWFYDDGTHLQLGGVGAKHLASIIQQAVRRR